MSASLGTQSPFCQAAAFGADAREGIERFRSLRLVEAFLDEFGVTQNGRKRCPQLMAHVGHELVLMLAGDLEVLDGFGEFECTRLHFFEEASILYGDDSLVGKGIDELDLAFGERANFGATHYDCTNRLARVDQRGAER